jgi:hypothetical protein
MPKQSPWKLPELKKGRVDIARLDIMHRSVHMGEASEWFTYSELIMRNIIMILLHVFSLLTEPVTYLRFNIMESSGRNPIWYTLLLTIFLPVKPLFIWVYTVICILFDGALISKECDDFNLMCMSLTEDAPKLKSCLFSFWAMQAYSFAKFTLMGRNTDYF